MTITTYLVDGMTCDHCARAVAAELSHVAGVAGVDVDVARGEVTVTSQAPLDDGAVRSAVEEAGYEVRA